MTTTHFTTNQPSPCRRHPVRRAMLIAFLLTSAVLAVAFGIVAVLRTDTSTSATSSAPTSQYSTYNEWRESVCKLGTYSESPYNGWVAPWSASCKSSESRGQLIKIEYYPDYYAADNAAALDHSFRASTVTAVDPTGATWLFISYQDSAALQPLTRFGFTVITP